MVNTNQRNSLAYSIFKFIHNEKGNTDFIGQKSVRTIYLLIYLILKFVQNLEDRKWQG